MILWVNEAITKAHAVNRVVGWIITSLWPEKIVEIVQYDASNNTPITSSGDKMTAMASPSLLCEP